MMRLVRAFGLFVLCCLGSGLADAGTPVGWRNDGTGCYSATKPPAEWSRDKNVLWKVALPGTSYAAAIAVQDRLFVVSDPSELLCIDSKDGKVLWRKSTSDIKAPAVKAGGYGKGGRGPGGKGPGGRGGMGGMGGNRSAGNTAATPISNGEQVAVVLGNGVVAVYTLDGKRVWGRFIESPTIGFGHSASPLLLDGKLIVHFKDLVALDLATGKEAWRTALAPTHASPVSARLGKDDVIISPAGAVVRAGDGKVLARGEFRSSSASPVVAGGDTVCVFGRGAYKLAAADGEVKVNKLWSNESASDNEGGRGGRGGPGGFGGPGGRNQRLASPLAHDGLLYNVSTPGMLEVVDVKTGKEVYRQRLGLNQVYSSVALAGDLLYAMDLQGKTVVFKPGRKFERVASNQLEGTGSCPLFVGDRLYVRGRQNLYCLSARAENAPKKESD